jgi:uncharacterized damage-inducible protein DinB
MDANEVTSVLARTPAVLESMLLGLPEEWVHRTDGPGTWSAYDIVGHLLHGEGANWLSRTHMILQLGPSRPFEAFDREAMLRAEREPIGDLLARFRATRTASLDELTALGLTASDMDRRGLHPEFGEVSLGQLLATWVAHDLTHLGQVGEVLARRYRDEVGPWRAYLPALDRTADAE